MAASEAGPMSARVGETIARIRSTRTQKLINAVDGVLQPQTIRR
jgi:hypothetical protein